MTDIWMKDSWKNPNVLFLFNHGIYEYDMEAAGFSLIREYHLLSDKKIAALEELGKEHRNIKIGLLERTDKRLVEQKKVAFQIARKQFFEANHLDENDCLAIRKDAIFTSKPCKHVRFGSYIHFREKNSYTSFLQLKKYKSRFDLYYNGAEDVIDIKGMSDNVFEKHKDGFGTLFRTFFRKMETDTHESTLRFIRRMVDRYKALDLELNYYREFNANSLFRTWDDETFDEYWDDKKEELNILYNYGLLLELPKILL